MQQLAAACLPAYVCPPGTKMHLLNLGTLNVDEGWYVNKTSLNVPLFRKLLGLAANKVTYRLLVGANGGTASNPNPTNKRRDLMLIAGLIEHPEMGLILFETGSAEDVDRVQPIPNPQNYPLFRSK
jgi:hypothetical protein